MNIRQTRYILIADLNLNKLIVSYVFNLNFSRHHRHHRHRAIATVFFFVHNLHGWRDQSTYFLYAFSVCCFFPTKNAIYAFVENENITINLSIRCKTDSRRPCVRAACSNVYVNLNLHIFTV